MLGREVEKAPQLMIVGDGPLRDAVIQRARELAIQDRLLMPGHLEYAEMPQIYHGACAFVLFSTTEQWGLVVNEAMSAGCPVLVSDRAGCVPELVSNGVNGFTVDPFDPKDLAEKLLYLHRHPSIRSAFGLRSRNIIGAFSPRAHADNVINVAKHAVELGSRRKSVRGRLCLSAMIIKHRFAKSV
jgi:glycosyltransferase involved in cell wall biosynthesis